MVPLRLRSTQCRIVVSAAALTLVSSPAFAQQPAVRGYSVSDGMASDAVTALTFDSHGFLWVGTRTSLARFDGTTFVNYHTDDGLPGQTINDIMEDRDGRIWIATNGGGVARFDPNAPIGAISSAARMFRVFPVGSTSATNRVNTLLEDDVGTVWAGTDDGVFRTGASGEPRFEPTARDHADAPRARGIGRLAHAADGTLWLGSFSGLIARFNDGTVVSFAGPTPREQRPVHAVVVDRQGLVWVASDVGVFVLKPPHRPNSAMNTTTVPSLFRSEVCRSDRAGLLRLPEGAGEACQLQLPGGPRDVDVRTIIETRDGRIVITTRTGQIAELEGGVLRWLATVAERPYVTDMVEDRVGNLWVGNLSSGLWRVARHGLVVYDLAAQLRSSQIHAILGTDGDALVMATSTFEVYRLQGGRLLRVPMRMPENPLPPAWQSALRDRRGDVWLGTGQGLFHFHPRADRPSMLGRPVIYTTQSGLASDRIGRLFEDSRGDIWISTGTGSDAALARWDGGTGRICTYPPSVEGGRFSQVIAFAEDRTGTVWLGLRDGGLARVREAGIELVPGTEDVSSNHLFIDRRGRLWANSIDGAIGFDDIAATRPQRKRYTTRDGLTSNGVFRFAEDRAGRLYIVTAAGLDRIDPDTGAIRHYGSAEGASLGEIVDAFAAADGALWFATRVGVARLSPGDEPAAARPWVGIAGLRIAGVPEPVAALGTRAVGPLAVPATRNSLQIDYFGVSADLGEPMRFEYRLDSLDTSWSVPTSGRSITYASLAPGAYRFSVRARTAGGQVSETPATIALEILPPFWRRWWFVALAVAVSGAGAYAVHRGRVSQLLRLERMRYRIATDLHDDVGASLSQIAILSDLGRAGLEQRDVRSVSDRLALIATTARQLVDSMSDIVWAVNPRRDSLDDLVHRMRRFAADTLEAADIQLAFTAPEASAAMRVGPDVRREVLLILKEAVTNIGRHSRATAAEIEFRVERHRMHLRVRDNGRGFDLAHDNPGNGLRSMRRRVTALGGRLEIESAAGRGTDVRFDVQSS